MSLTPIENFKGAKNKHPTTRCICDCGNERVVRTTRLRRKQVDCCAVCAKANGAKRGAKTRSLPEAEKELRERFSIYKNNAKRKRLKFEIELDQFAAITASACSYCGITSKIGIDRIDNDIGYLMSNCVPCCADCNYAKRDMSKEEFLRWVRRIYAHQSR